MISSPTCSLCIFLYIVCSLPYQTCSLVKDPFKRLSLAVPTRCSMSGCHLRSKRQKESETVCQAFMPRVERLGSVGDNGAKVRSGFCMLLVLVGCTFVL